MNDLYEGLSIIYMGQYPAVHMPQHPRANCDGLVYVHQLVAEKMLGRYLSNSECVHHIDENKSNYNESNLIVFASVGEHQRYHNALKYNLDYCLYKKSGLYYCITGEAFIKRVDNVHKCMTESTVQIRSICPNCGNLKSERAKLCISCYKFDKSLKLPSKKELEQLVFTLKNFSKISKIYGVSDNAVRKWCRKYGLPYKTSDLKLLADDSDVVRL